MKPIARGFVISAGKKYFWWRFTLRRELHETDHTAEVLISKLSARERPFLCQGAYLNVLKGGTFRFCRLRWKKCDLARAKKHGERLFKKVRKRLTAVLIRCKFKKTSEADATRRDRSRDHSQR